MARCSARPDADAMQRCARRHFRYQRAANRLPHRYVATTRPILVRVVEHDPLRYGLWDTLRAGISLRHDASGLDRVAVGGEDGSVQVERFAVRDGELAGACVEWLVPGPADPMDWLRADERPAPPRRGMPKRAA